MTSPLDDAALAAVLRARGRNNSLHDIWRAAHRLETLAASAHVTDPAVVTELEARLKRLLDAVGGLVRDLDDDVVLRHAERVGQIAEALESLSGDAIAGIVEGRAAA